MSTTPDVFTYLPVEALQALSLADVEARWELVPTDRQRAYRAIYERTRRDEGAAGSDSLEEAMLTQLLARYADKGLVPVGAYWVPTPPQLQAAAKADAAWVPSPPDVSTPQQPTSILLGAGVVGILILGFLLVRGVTSDNAAGARKSTVAANPTRTLARTYTPTPLALDAQDTIIQGGNAGGSGVIMYPVNLRVAIPQVPQPRLFVVQRRRVTTAEWLYEDNPDVASYLVGLTVHPVLGIPWSEANAELFRQAVPGTVLSLQMNTGAVQRFICTQQRTTGRGDTSAFAQTRPGLTLVLLGQQAPEEEATPTDERWILIADYAPMAEDSSSLLPTMLPPAPTLAPTAAQRVDVDVIRAATQADRLLLRLRIFNGQTIPLLLDSQSIWLAFGYAERPSGPQVAAELHPVTIAPFQAADVSLTMAWHGEPYAMLGVLDDYQYALTLR